MSEPRRFAYADPPYPRQARKRYTGGADVNLPILLAHLDTFDGWALHTSAPALREVWNLAPHARCGAWTKTYAANGWSRVRYSWEPVLFVTPDKGIAPGERSTAWDSIVCAPVTSVRSWQEVHGAGAGAKPYDVVRWIIDDLLGMTPDDQLVDLFPGSGGVGRHASTERLELDLT